MTDLVSGAVGRDLDIKKTSSNYDSMMTATLFAGLGAGRSSTFVRGGKRLRQEWLDAKIYDWLDLICSRGYQEAHPFGV
jgi:hypothetical protein